MTGPFLQAILAYACAHAIELFAAACGVIGTLTLALNGPRAGWGFVWYLASNAGWIAFSIATAQWPLLAQNIVFTASSLVGVWVWLIRRRKARPPLSPIPADSQTIRELAKLTNHGQGPRSRAAPSCAYPYCEAPECCGNPPRGRQ